ncbi:MAG TPA: amidase family protein, partial [Acidimicrobiales bacterium]|nr:amidase family protein [Acidimicrobiales bacterium]
MTTQLWRESATTLAAMIRKSEVTSREVTESLLERIDTVNEQVNGVVEVRPDEALDEADRADARQHAGAALGAWHGVPFTVKVNIDVTGYATTQGVAALRELVAPADAPVVERMREAGGVMLARTNMPDFGLRINTESSLYGPAHNPWRRGVTTGGSSGGEAASIASGMSVIGFGNDIGGSLRNPAYCCGVASIKPSRGRVAQGNPSAQTTMPLNSQIMLAEGVLARTVEDVRRGLEAVMGAHWRDPQSIDAPLI